MCIVNVAKKPGSACPLVTRLICGESDTLGKLTEFTPNFAAYVGSFTGNVSLSFVMRSHNSTSV